jgi:hypothetical protein
MGSRPMKFILTGFICLLLITPHTSAQTNSDQDASASVRSFVQDFYNWYIPLAMRRNSKPDYSIAIWMKPKLFSPELVHKLHEDAKAQAKADEIVGLDFDPFLASQYPDENYKIGIINKKNDSYWVDIDYAPPEEKVALALTAEVRQQDGQWYFNDFRYPDGQTLLQLLQTLKKEREKLAAHK